MATKAYVEAILFIKLRIIKMNDLYEINRKQEYFTLEYHDGSKMKNCKLGETRKRIKLH